MRASLLAVFLVSACPPVHDASYYRELAKAYGPGAEARAVAARILKPHPDEEEFVKLLDLWPRLSPDQQQEIIELGTDPSKPIHVPGFHMQYLWVVSFPCRLADPVRFTKSMVPGPIGILDLLEFECPDGSEHKVYFFLSKEPLRQAMR